MFNISGSELVFLLLIALIVLGPEKLPEAIRTFAKVYSELKKMSAGFQDELSKALDEPMREMRETAEAIKNAANFDFDADVDTAPFDDAGADASGNASAPRTVASVDQTTIMGDEPRIDATPPPSSVSDGSDETNPP